MTRWILGIFFLCVTKLVLAFPVTLTTTIEGGDKPVVVGKTNLPDGMSLMVSLTLRDNTYYESTEAVVTSGQFRAGPFTKKGVSLDPGTYQVEVMSPLPEFQSSSVQAVIGQSGEELSGALSKNSKFGSGRAVEYTTTIKIGTERAAINGEKARTQATLNATMYATKKLSEIIQQGRSMERLRNDNFSAVAECGKQMRIWQPRARELSETLGNKNFKAAATEGVLCVSCLSSAKTFCDKAEEWMNAGRK